MTDTSCNHYNNSREGCGIPRDPKNESGIQSGSGVYVPCDNDNGRTCPTAKNYQKQLADIAG